MAISELLTAGIRQLAEQAVSEQGLEGSARAEALITLMEEIAVEVGDALAREILKRQLAAQAAVEQPICPHCALPGLRKKHRKRLLLSSRGPVEFHEPECYCQRCRRSFFPAVGSFGSGCEL